MKRAKKASIKGPLILSTLFHLALIAIVLIGYPIINHPKAINIPYNVKLFEPKLSKQAISKTKTVSNKQIKNTHIKKQKAQSKKQSIKKAQAKKKVTKKISKKNIATKKVSLNPSKKKRKISITKKLKKNNKNTEEVKLKKKLHEIEQKVKEKQEEEYLQKRLAALQKELKKKASSSSFAQGKNGNNGHVNNALRQYAGLIWMKVRKNWHFPEYLLKNKQIEAVIAITINNDGKILNKRFEKRSGFPAFDRSVLKAISDSNPLPPLPKALGTGPIEIGIRFNPNRMNL